MKIFLIILLLALIASSCGFHRYVWFISLGYGAAVALIGAGLFFLFSHALTIGTILQCVLFIIYGCRLSGYLIYRDRKTAYKRRMKGEVKADDGVSMGAKMGIWISASLLYVLQTSPVVFRLMSTKETDAFCIAGILISTCGLILETAADIQEALKDLLGGTIKEMMEAEMDDHLGDEKSERSDSDDYRNGYKEKTVNSSYGSMWIDVPQDRKSTFEPKVVKKRQKDISDIDQKIISMYAKGMTTRQISDTLMDIYGFEASEGFISDVTDKILPQILSIPSSL